MTIRVDKLVDGRLISTATHSELDVAIADAQRWEAVSDRRECDIYVDGKLIDHLGE